MLGLFFIAVAQGFVLGLLGLVTMMYGPFVYGHG